MSVSVYDSMLSLTEAAAYLGCSEQTLRRYVHKGLIAHYRTPGNWMRFKKEDLDATVMAGFRSRRHPPVSYITTEEKS